jgi:hypothetical protein
MRRLNPDTGEFFKQGEWRDDGFRFWGYSKKKYKKTGYFIEFWRSNEKYETELKKIVKWQADNRDKVNGYAATVRAKRIKRKPRWIKDVFEDEIKVWYKRAKVLKHFTGQLWEVDHIVPLNGKKVSGLHVPWNLQLLTKKQNRDKSNKHAN